MDMLTLMVLAEQKKHVQYRLPAYMDASRSVYRAHAACLFTNMANITASERDNFIAEAVQIACTTGDCRWCGLPLVSRPHHSLQKPKAARLSKVVGARNMDPYKRAAPLVFDFETFTPVTGTDFTALRPYLQAQGEVLAAHGYNFDPTIYRK